MDAIDKFLGWKSADKIIVKTSRHSLREMERAPFRYRANLKEGISDLGLAKDDHRILGFHTQSDLYGCISYPLITDKVDEKLYSDLREFGLKNDDAQHSMYVIHNGYHRFLTCDKAIIGRRIDLEKRFPLIRLQKPSEAVAELSPQIDG